MKTTIGLLQVAGAGIESCGALPGRRCFCAAPTWESTSRIEERLCVTGFVRGGAIRVVLDERVNEAPTTFTQSRPFLYR